MGRLPSIRTALPRDLASLPHLERAADTVFAQLGIGPMPGPGTVEEFAAALVVLVAGDPPVGLCRIDAVAGGAHLEQVSVLPDQAGHGIGRALVRAALAWAREAGYDELTLVTYRDVPWNGPFYASEGFVELGPAEGWLAGRGLPPEDPVMAEGGTRVVMARRL